MNSFPYLLYLSLLLFHGCLNIQGVKQHKTEEDGKVVVTDGSELQGIFEQQSTRDNPTQATKLSNEEGTGLETAPGNDNGDKQDIDFRSLTDGTSGKLQNERAEISSENKRRVTSGNPDVFGNVRQYNDIETRESGNQGANSEQSHDSKLVEESAEAKIGDIKLVQRVGKGITELESSTRFEAQNSPDLNLSKSTPPPFIKKVKNTPARAELDDIYFLFIVIGCSVAGIAGLALAGYCWYKLHTTAKAVSEAEYSGYGSSKQTLQVAQGDHKLDYSAEMYHYHQTKSQLSAMEKAGGSKSRIKGDTLDDDENSDEGDEEDYTVYECHGLAPTGDMTVVNPLFSDQEIVGSDQDANGDRSGASGQGSPVSSRHTPRES